VAWFFAEDATSIIDGGEPTIGPAAIADAIEYERQVIDGIECYKGEIQVAGNSGDITQYRPKL